MAACSSAVLASLTGKLLMMEWTTESISSEKFMSLESAGEGFLDSVSA